MKKYIDKELAVEIFQIRAEELSGLYGDLGGACSGAAKLIERIPDEDVIEKRTGEWIELAKSAYSCSKCYMVSFKRTSFCPYCGRDMRGEEDA